MGSSGRRTSACRTTLHDHRHSAGSGKYWPGAPPCEARPPWVVGGNWATYQAAVAHLVARNLAATMAGALALASWPPR
eukprot:5051281-Pyramimonas_sp.AAC.1